MPVSEQLRLDLEGMSCASCASSIERRLNELDGVEATVNLATEQATVRCEPPVPVEELVAAVESIGYGARPHEPHAGGHMHHDEPLDVLRARLAVSAVLSVPVVLLSMVSALQFCGLGMGGIRPLDPGRLLRWARIPPARLAQCAPRARHHGHPDLARHPRGLDLVDRRPRGRHLGGHLLRGRRRRDDADPARPLPGGACQGPCVAGDPGAARARREGCSRHPRRPGGARAGERARGRRRVRRSPGREDRDRRRRRRGRVGGRPLDAHR